MNLNNYLEGSLTTWHLEKTISINSALGPVTSLAMDFAYVYSTRYGFTLTWKPLILKSKLKKKQWKGIMWHRSWETWGNIYSSKVGNQWQTKVRISPKPSLMNQWMLLIDTTYTSRGEALLTGAEMTQRSLHHWKPTPAWVTSHENWKLGAYCPNCREPIILEHAISE